MALGINPSKKIPPKLWGKYSEHLKYKANNNTCQHARYDANNKGP